MPGPQERRVLALGLSKSCLGSSTVLGVDCLGYKCFSAQTCELKLSEV